MSKYDLYNVTKKKLVLHSIQKLVLISELMHTNIQAKELCDL